MNPQWVKYTLGILLLPCLISIPLRAQDSSATLAGTVTNASGSPIANANISVANTFSGQTAGAQTDAAGHYNLPNLAPGEYQVSVSAEGFSTKVARVKLSAGATETLQLALTASSGTATTPSLSSLGFPSSEVQGSAKEQALLNKRSHMLQIHQKLGMITVAAMAAALITSGGAKSHHGLPGSPTGRNVHMALGDTTAALYLATAYFAIRAPKVQGVETRGPIRLHKALAWVHGPGMIMTAVLGAMAYEQLSKGERVHGIAKYHSTAAIVTTAALGTAVFAVSFKF